MLSRISSTDFWFLLVGAASLVAGSALLGLGGSYDMLFLALAASPYTALWLASRSFALIPKLAAVPLRSEIALTQLSANQFILREFRRWFSLPVIAGTSLPIAVLLLLLPPEWVRLRHQVTAQLNSELMDDAAFCVVCSAAAFCTALTTASAILMALAIECRAVARGRSRQLIHIAFVIFGALFASFISAEYIALYSVLFSRPNSGGLLLRILFGVASVGGGYLVFVLCLECAALDYYSVEATPH